MSCRVPRCACCAQVRVPLSKEERKRLKAQRREGLAGRALLDDFADDIADLVAGTGGWGGLCWGGRRPCCDGVSEERSAVWWGGAR